MEPGSQRRYTLAWFKESVIISLFGRYTSRRHQVSNTGNHPTLSIQSLEPITQHQVQPIKNLLSDFPSDKGRYLICKTSQSTACIECKQVYCYTCGRQHPYELLLQHALQIRWKQKAHKVYPSVLNRIHVYRQQQQTSCQTVIVMRVDSTPQVMMISECILGLTWSLPAKLVFFAQIVICGMWIFHKVC